MNIAVLSDCRVPTRATGGHGLGRLAWDIAAGLAKYGHGILFCAGEESERPDGAVLYEHTDELARAQGWEKSSLRAFTDVYIDLSHNHDLSRIAPDLPVINWVVDLECRYEPPNAVVGNAWQRKAFPDARI